jgi:hypothetical protein
MRSLEETTMAETTKIKITSLVYRNCVHAFFAFLEASMSFMNKNAFVNSALNPHYCCLTIK